MADSSISVTQGVGTTVDTRTEGTNGNHRQVVVLGDPTTNAGVAPVDATNGLAVEVKASVPGTAANNLGKAEDAVHSSGDTGVMSLAVRKDTAAALAGADGDYAPLEVDAVGSLHVSSHLDTYAVDDSAMPATPKVIPIAGEYRLVPTTYTDGDVTVLQTDANGSAKATLATQLAGEDLTNDVIKVENRFNYAYISTATTTQVKAGAGFLHSITVNTTAAGTISIIDNTSGSTVNIGSLKASVAEGTYTYNVSFSAGLRIITAGASDITISYR